MDEQSGLWTQVNVDCFLYPGLTDFSPPTCFTSIKYGSFSTSMQTEPNSQNWQHCHTLVCYTNAGHHHPSRWLAKQHPFMACGDTVGRRLQPSKDCYSQDKLHVLTAKHSSSFKSHIDKPNQQTLRFMAASGANMLPSLLQYPSGCHSGLHKMVIQLNNSGHTPTASQQHSK